MFTTKFFQASFAAALVLVSLSASSQSMTQPNLPNHGFTFTYGVTTSQPSGFDWSTETSIQNVEFAFVPADSSAYGDAFPEADFSQQIVAATGGLTEQFYAYNEEGMDFWGFVDGATGLQVTHPEAIQFIPYPYAAGDIHSDSLEFEFMANGLSVFRRQILQQEVLESGTLTLPNELSFEGALRVDATQSVYDSTVTGALELLIVGEMYWVQDMPLHVAATYDYYQIVGVDTTLAFGHFAMNHEAFRSGNFDTGFVAEHFSPEKLDRPFPCDDATAADLILGAMDRLKDDAQNATMPAEAPSAWRMRVR